MTKKQAIEKAKQAIRSSFKMRVVWIVNDTDPGKVSVTGYRAGHRVPTVIETYEP
jgi:hypothetical protein